MNLDHYVSLSKLFDYPEDNYHDNVVAAANAVSKDYPEAAAELEKFLKLLPMQTREMEELYSRSFDVQAVTTLDVGYVLFGDDYQRGEVLVHLNNEHSKAGNSCGQELGDHLPILLKLLPKLEDTEVKNELVTMLIAPAVEKMMNEYTSNSMEAKDKLYTKQYKTLIAPASPLAIYLHAFTALYIVLDKDFSLIKENKPFQDKSFLTYITGELEIQEGKQSSNSCGTGSCGTGSCT